MILLDTHVIVWMVEHDPQLGRRAIEAVERESDRRASAMVAWEIAMNIRKGRMSLSAPLATWLQDAYDSLDVREMLVTGNIALDAGSLGDGLHGDPCDRIMISTARALGCPLVTADRKILAYAAAGHLKAIDAGQ